MKINSDRAIAITNLVREMNNFARGNGLNVLAIEKETTTLSFQQKSEGRNTDELYDSLARILEKRSIRILGVRSSSSA